MTDLRGGETILSRQLRMLEQANVSDVVITTGYYKDVLIDYCLSLNTSLNFTFVHNEIYDKTNYIYSIYCAKDKLYNQDVIMMHGDLVFSEEVLQSAIKQSKSCMVVSSTIPLPEKDFKAVINNGRIYKVGIEFFDNALAAQPLYVLYKNDWNVWLENIIKFCENGVVKCYAENAFNEVSSVCEIYALDVFDNLCAEIDTPSDLNLVSKKLKGENL
jgi:phosphoenolpyruvate phosphomutase